MNIAQQLLLGSVQINRMQREIGQVENILLELLSTALLPGWSPGEVQSYPFRRFSEKVVESLLDRLDGKSLLVCNLDTEFYWCPYKIQIRETDWELWFDVSQNPRGDFKFKYIWNKSSHLGRISSVNTAQIHSKLPALIDAFAKMFPEIQNIWQPLLDAAVEV